MSVPGSQSPDDGMHGSWVELEGVPALPGSRESVTGPPDSTAPLLQGELERILLEAQLECERTSNTDSPPQQGTPRSAASPQPASEGSSGSDCVILQPGSEGSSSSDCVILQAGSEGSSSSDCVILQAGSEGSSSSDCVILQLDEGERRTSAEWVWDWSSRPENLPPKEFSFQHPKQQTSTLSVRKSEVMKRRLFSSEVLLVLIPSLVASHLLTLGLGLYIGKRLAASSTSTL